MKETRKYKQKGLQKRGERRKPRRENEGRKVAIRRGKEIMVRRVKRVRRRENKVTVRRGETMRVQRREERGLDTVRENG